MDTLKMYLNLVHNHPELFQKSKSGLLNIITNLEDIKTWQKQKRSTLIREGKPVVWADVGIVLDDPYFLVLRDLVEFPEGFQGGYHRLINRAYIESGSAGVAILCEKEGNLLLFRHFRHSTRDWHWEIPRGFGEPGITAAEQAKAEIREEVDGEVSELIDLGIFHNNTGIEGHPINLYFARLLSSGRFSSEARIDMLRWVAVKDLENMIVNVEITDSFTIATYARAKLKKLI